MRGRASATCWETASSSTPGKSDRMAVRTCASAGLVLTAALALSPVPATAQDGVPPRSQQEEAKQESIFRSQGEKVPGGYITTRGLSGYAQFLPSGFEAALKKLGSRDRWLDIGAGSGRAILDYHSPEYGQDGNRARRGKARAVALSIEDRRTDLWHERAAGLETGRIRYLFGKRLRDYSAGELGKFRMITDVYGGFSYTDELSLFMEQVLGLLEMNGSFYSLLQSVRL